MWGQKLGHRVKLKENLVNTLEVTVLTRFSSNLVSMFVSMKSGSFQNWVTWGKKLGHGVKLMENLVNTL